MGRIEDAAEKVNERTKSVIGEQDVPEGATLLGGVVDDGRLLLVGTGLDQEEIAAYAMHSASLTIHLARTGLPLQVAIKAVVEHAILTGYLAAEATE